MHHRSSLSRNAYRSDDGVERCEWGDSCRLASYPTELIDHGGVGEHVRQSIRKNLEQGVSQRVCVVVHVGLDDAAVDAVDDGLVIFVKGELDVGFAELDLLPASGGSGMQEPGILLFGELMICGGGLDEWNDSRCRTRRRSDPVRAPGCRSR